jgi:1-acyl-sn-glycerol-3-phosphate acyltransferase
MAQKKTSLLSKILDDNKLQDYINVFPNSVGSYGYDAWGFNIRNMKNNMRLIKYLYEDYFHAEAFGLENIPKNGRCLIIANHSGQLPFDGSFVGYAMLTNPHGPRAPKAMMERFIPSVPFIGNWLNSSGSVIGDPVNCERMLEKEEAVIVFPEGVRGSNKLYKLRYQLQRFGNGFMHLAMKHDTPIIPVGIVGMEESIRSYADIKPLAKLLGMPVAPLVIPYFFKSKVYIHFGKPMYFKNDIHKETDIKHRVDMVKAAIDELLQEGLAMRTAYLEAQKEIKK